MKLFVPRYAKTAWGMKNVNQHMLSCVGAVLWISVILCSPSIRPSPQIAAAACKSRHICDWSHRIEIYPEWSLGAREGRWCPIQWQRILQGVVSQQHWLIGLAGLKRGLAQDGGIGSLPLIIFPLREPGPQKSKLCHRVWDAGGGRGDTRRALCRLTSHAACHGVMPRALAVVSDVIVIEELSGGMRTAVIY